MDKYDKASQHIKGKQKDRFTIKEILITNITSTAPQIIPDD